MIHCNFPYFVSNAKAIIPAACGAENDVPCSPSTQEEAKDVDVWVDILKILRNQETTEIWALRIQNQMCLSKI